MQTLSRCIAGLGDWAVSDSLLQALRLRNVSLPDRYSSVELSCSRQFPTSASGLVSCRLLQCPAVLFTLIAEKEEKGREEFFAVMLNNRSTDRTRSLPSNSTLDQECLEQ